MIFYRALYTEIWLRLKSNESLGILDSDYIEDYFGTDGQLSLYHIEGSTTYPILMSALSSETPSVSNDVFEGFYSLSSVPDGTYRVRGRVKDTSNNYTILSEVQTPYGGERVTTLEFKVREGIGVALDLGLIIIFGGYTLNCPPVELADFQLDFKKFKERKAKMLVGKTLKTSMLGNLTLNAHQTTNYNFDLGK